ncbi:ATP-binding cassette domain-containing protein [candidate division KSB1 bacterium]|nr:ATP-binding cassette domain-containing protein [candidate division KSB1 bacterium]
MLLKCDKINKYYRSTTRAPERTVLEDLDLSVETGTSLAIVGPSGSGKSTLLNLIGLLDKPSAGTLYFNDRNSEQMDENARARIRNREIGFIFQMHHLLPQCTVLENVLIPTLADPGKNEPDHRSHAETLLQRVGLLEHAHKLPGRLSGGEQQRVAVVRALINRPKLLLADEPTGSLDQRTADQLADLLIELNQEQSQTLVMVTHSQRLAERMERTLYLRDGRLWDHDQNS